MGRLPTQPGAHAVLPDPTQPKRVYAAGDGGLYRSDDAGQTWQPATEGLADGSIAALALDPRQPQRLYAATLTGALYGSEDGANSWRTLTPTATDARR